MQHAKNIAATHYDNTGLSGSFIAMQKSADN